MTYLRVKNWKRYQNEDLRKKTKDGRLPWVKQWRDFWSDYDLSTLEPDIRLLTLFLVSFASEFIGRYDEDGGFPRDEREIARRAGLELARVEAGMAELVRLGFLEVPTNPDLSRVALESIESVSRASSRENLPLEAEAEAEAEVLDPGVSGLASKAAGSIAEAALEEPNFERERELRRLVEAVNDSDDGTLAVFRREARGLPFGAIAKVRESCELLAGRKGKPGAGYAVNALRSERKERAA